jgi:hypothetical protein
MISGPTILTADGLYFDFLNPSADCVTLNAIARGLANACRYGNQCAPFYSVAEHSIWVSRIVPPEFALAGLFHDAAEAFILDMPKPLKEILPDYKAIEKRVEAVVFPALGLPATLPPEVKAADRQMLATEQLVLMNNSDAWEWTDGLVPAKGLKLKCYPPAEAYHAFIARAHKLGFGGADSSVT